MKAFENLVMAVPYGEPVPQRFMNTTPAIPRTEGKRSVVAGMFPFLGDEEER